WVGRTHRQASGGEVGDDSGHGITAAVVLAQDLAEEAPDGGDGTEQPVAILDAVLLKGVEDTEFAQGVGERESLVAREASADLLQGGHRGSRVSGDWWGGPQRRDCAPSPDEARACGNPTQLHRTRKGLTTNFVCNFIRGQPLRLCLQHSADTPPSAVALALSRPD